MVSQASESVLIMYFLLLVPFLLLDLFSSHAQKCKKKKNEFFFFKFEKERKKASDTNMILKNWDWAFGREKKLNYKNNLKQEKQIWKIINKKNMNLSRI